MTENTKKERQNINASTDLSFGTAIQNNIDQNALFPKVEHWNSSNLNFAALGSTYNELYTGGSYADLPLSMGSPVEAKYPLNQVQETQSGHVIEINDTPSGERILINHKEGSGIDLRPDGTVIVSSKGSKIEISGDDQTVIVEGNANLVYKGDLNVKVTGDLNYDVAGNINVKTRNRTETILGSDRKTVNGNVGQIIRGGYSTTVTQQVTDTFLGGHSHNVKGTFSNNIDGDANYFSSGISTITSESRSIMSTPDLDIRATSLDIWGASGVIGSTGMLYSGNGAIFEKGVTASKFTGDLDGTAQNAVLGGTDTDPGSSHSFSVSGDGTPSITKPTPAAITEDLSEPDTGIRKILIDVGSFLKNFIDKSTAYDGIDTVDQTTGQVRSKLRDEKNRSNSKYISSVISEGLLSTNYFNASPPAIGRSITGNSSPKFGQTRIGQVTTNSAVDPFLPVRVEPTNILPDPFYNPNTKDKLTSATKLAPGVTLGRFFGATNDPTNIDFIKDQTALKQIARNLYPQAVLIRSIQLNNGAFKNYKLDVAEGVYRPGPKEIITANSINDLKSKGRAIVYELFNESGELAIADTFDLAEFWKDTVNFEKMILSYDTVDPTGKLRAQIILIMPELDETFSARYNRKVETHFNNQLQSQDELVEILNN